MVYEEVMEAGPIWIVRSSDELWGWAFNVFCEDCGEGESFQSLLDAEDWKQAHGGFNG